MGVLNFRLDGKTKAQTQGNIKEKIKIAVADRQRL